MSSQPKINYKYKNEGIMAILKPNIEYKATFSNNIFLKFGYTIDKDSREVVDGWVVVPKCNIVKNNIK
jgi:hypothetical protein